MQKLNTLLLGIALIVSSHSLAEAGGKNKPTPIPAATKPVVAKGTLNPSKKHLKVTVQTPSNHYFKGDVVPIARLGGAGMLIDLQEVALDSGVLKVEVEGLGVVSPLAAAVFEGVAKLTARRFNTSRPLQLEFGGESYKLLKTKMEKIAAANPTWTRQQVLVDAFEQLGLSDVFTTLSKLGYDGESVRLDLREVRGTYGASYYPILHVDGIPDTRPMMARLIAGLRWSPDVP